MNREFVVDDPLKVLLAEEIVEDDAKVVGILPFLILRLKKLGRHVIILNDRGPSVLEAEGADLLVRRDLAHDLSAGRAAAFQSCSDEAGIRDPLQNIVDREDIEPLDAQLLRAVKNARVHHGQEPAAVSVGRRRDPVIGLHVHLAVIIYCGRHILLEEKDHALIVAKIVHLLHEADCLLVVLVARHDKERHIHTRFADYIHQVLDQALHDIDRFGNTDIIHALGVVGTETGSHTSGQKHRADLACAQRGKADLSEVLLVLLDLADLHSAERLDLSSLLIAVRILRIADHGEIGLIDLFEEHFFLFIGKRVVMIEDVKLSILIQFFFCLFQIHTHCLYSSDYCCIYGRARFPQTVCRPPFVLFILADFSGYVYLIGKSGRMYCANKTQAYTALMCRPDIQLKCGLNTHSQMYRSNRTISLPFRVVPSVPR